MERSVDDEQVRVLVKMAVLTLVEWQGAHIASR